MHIRSSIDGVDTSMNRALSAPLILGLVLDNTAILLQVAPFLCRSNRAKNVSRCTCPKWSSLAQPLRLSVCRLILALLLPIPYSVPPYPLRNYGWAPTFQAYLGQSMTGSGKHYSPVPRRWRVPSSRDEYRTAYVGYARDISAAFVRCLSRSRSRPRLL